MKKAFDQVKEFHLTSGAPVLKSPTIPDSGRVDLRVSLLEEEVNEFYEAASKRDIVGVLDALIDIQYVLIGAAHEFGLSEVFEEAFDEVQASNMSKFCSTTEMAKNSTHDYIFASTKSKRVDAYYKKVGDLFVVRRTSDDKILKGRNYFAPKLKEIIEKFKQKQDEQRKEAFLENNVN